MQVALCAIFKNEALYLKEWIAYHLAIGFDEIHLYDNESTDASRSVIENLSLPSVLKVKPWPGHPVQLTAYSDFINNQKDSFEWAAFIDIDEFIVLYQDRRIQALLQDFAGFSAIHLHWLNFGPHGHVERPNTLITETYLTRFATDHDVHRHVKSIVRLNECVGVSENPHVFGTSGPQCNTAKQIVVPSGWQEASEHKRAAINHYFTRSEQDWREKVSRGRATTTARYSVNDIDNIRHESTAYDGRILARRAELRASISLLGGLDEYSAE